MQMTIRVYVLLLFSLILLVELPFPKVMCLSFLYSLFTLKLQVHFNALFTENQQKLYEVNFS